MPKVYLSPSTQEFNPYIIGGNEEYYMNLIADALVPYLTASGISYVRNSKDMNASGAINQSNSGKYDLHLALHSNASPDNMSGQLTGIDVYYAKNSKYGKRGAEIFARNLKSIYLNPQKVKVMATTDIGEVMKTKAPSIFIEMGYHDNVNDATWIKDNIEIIARNLALSTAEYFGLPLVEPIIAKRGIVNVNFGNLNLREKPDITSKVIARMPDSSQVTIVGQWKDWYVVNYRGMLGYASSAYIDLI